MNNNNINYYILAELREDHKSLYDDGKVYNDYVSKQSMMDLAATISELGYNCSYIGGIPKLIDMFNSGYDCSDCLFINYNYGLPRQFKRGQSPIILEMMNAKYSGSDPFVSLLVNDKYCSKRIVEKSGIYVPKSKLISKKSDIENINEPWVKFPLVVKPNTEGSSLGIDKKSLCYTYEDVRNKCEELLLAYGSALIEEYIQGYEITVWIIGNKNNYELIAPLSISIDDNYFFESKIITMNDKANRVRNYSLSKKLFSSNHYNNILKTSKKIFESLEMRDYGRIDFRFDGTQLFFIEANALPIFSKTSEIGQISRLYGISYKDICQKLINAINARLLVSKAD